MKRQNASTGMGIQGLIINNLLKGGGKHTLAQEFDPTLFIGSQYS
jgi:hypothetical protein